jgi:NADPH:quinone reductase-like Zn-dependent oxidoreductase
VLVLGSGGVSLIALALARALGAEVIATSSSDEKLARVQALGAAHLVNYKTTPEWGAYIAKEFGGAHKVVEVGGVGTLPQSIAALAPEGEIALIGVLADGEPPHPRALMMTGGSIRGIFVGSVAMARELNAFVDAHAVDPVIGARFGFDDVPAAYAHAWGPDSFGKTVITLG